MKPSSPASSPEQEFPYGWRCVRRTGPDGAEALEQAALTLEDVLHPQEGDVIPENTDHDADCVYLETVFRDRPLSPPFAFVSHDLLVDWGVAGLRNHSPDLAVFVGLSRDPRPTGLLDLRAFNGQCELVVEVVSPNTRNNDVVEKVNHYHRVGIPLYVLIDQEREGGPRWVRAFRWAAAQYAEVAPDPQGRVALPVLGLLLGVRDGRAVCFDAATQEEIEDFSGQRRGREMAREQLSQYKEEAEQEIAEQVKARHAAEREADRQRQEAANKSQEAEKQRQEAEKQRQEAEKQRQEAEKQRQEAEKQRQEAEKRRLALEEVEKQKALAEEQAAKVISDLQEKLRLLQGGGDPAQNPATG